MSLKLIRVFFGNYIADDQKLIDMHYVNLRLPRLLITATNPDQGYGQIKGAIKKLGQNYSSVPVCCFKRSNRQLLWETISGPDGTYVFRNIAVGLECFVVAFDPNGQYNAVISDKLVAK